MAAVHGTGGHGGDIGANNGMPCLIDYFPVGRISSVSTKSPRAAES